MITTPTLPLETVFQATAKASAELGRSWTSLSPVQLELLIRTDGCTSLRATREAMPHVDDDAFGAAFKVLWQRQLLQQTPPDTFSITSALQLQTMAAALGDTIRVPGGARAQDAFSMGLVWNRPGTRTHAAGQPPCAVVVEDDPVLAKFIQCFLALEAFQVRLAANREEVVASLRAPTPPDLVLLDVMLPDADGFDVLRRMREHPRLRAVPVLMLTGRATREAVLQALACGANGYLTKPFDADVLAQAVRAAAGLEPAGAVPCTTNPWRNADALPERALRRAA